MLSLWPEHVLVEYYNLIMLICRKDPSFVATIEKALGDLVVNAKQVSKLDTEYYYNSV